MAGFEPGPCGVGSDRSGSCAKPEPKNLEIIYLIKDIFVKTEFLKFN